MMTTKLIYGSSTGSIILYEFIIAYNLIIPNTTFYYWRKQTQHNLKIKASLHLVQKLLEPILCTTVSDLSMYCVQQSMTSLNQ